MVFRRAIAWSVGGQLFCYVALFVGSVIVARALSPHDMGVFAIAMATIGILNVLTGFNAGAYVVKAKELKSITLDAAFTVNALMALASGAAIFGFSLIERWGGQRDVADVLGPLAVSAVIALLGFRPNTMLQREMNFKAIAFVQMGTAVLSTVLTVVLALFGFRFMSLAYGNLCSAVASVIAFNLIGHKHRSLRLSLHGAKDVAIFGVQMISIGGVATISQKLSDVLLGNILGLTALGLYSRASSISSLIFDNVYGSITRVIFVRLSNENQKSASLKDLFFQSLQMLTALFWPLQLGLAVLSAPAIFCLYGEKWLPAAVPLSLLMIAQVIALSFAMNWELFIIKGETALQTRFEVIRAVIGVGLFATGCMFNISAAAMARICESCFGFILYRPHLCRLGEFEGQKLLKMLSTNFALALLAVLPSGLLMMYENWSYKTPLPLICLSVFFGSTMWLFGLARLRHPLFFEIRNLTTSMQLSRN